MNIPIPTWIPVLLLAAALLCSLVGRILIVGSAFNISTGWGMAVLFAPLGPGFFRQKYEDICKPTQYWRMAVGPLMLLFFVTGGSLDSFQSLLEVGKPSAPSGNVISSLLGQKPAVQATPAPAPVLAQATPEPKATPAVAKATPAPKATPSPAVAAAAAKMAPALTIQEISDRIEANQREFARLAEWYDQLKHERGYLRKHDEDAIAAYNDEAAKYQAAVTAAKAEQATIAKLSAKK